MPDTTRRHNFFFARRVRAGQVSAIWYNPAPYSHTDRPVAGAAAHDHAFTA
ncbi:MAG: hypothetical protein WKF30_05810 [Pyrinomonadaceae bacterium]